MRTVPLLFLTLALSATADDPAETGGDGWTRPNDREPADDWSERTGIPSPFPCRADMVWCDSHKADMPNPDGTHRGTWVPSAGWFGPDDPRAVAPDTGHDHESPYVDALLAAFEDRGEADALVASLASHAIEARIVADQSFNPEHGGAEPVFGVVVKVQIPDRRCGDAHATIDTAPLREAAVQLAETAGEALAVADEVLKADDADDSH